MIKRITLLVVMALVLTAFPIMGVGATDAHPALTPETVEAVVVAGTTFDVQKTVHTPEIPPNPAIVFLADTTGSMGGVLANVASNGTPIMNAVLAAQPTAVFGAAEYRDISDAFIFQVNQGLTGTVATVQTAMNGWSAGGGGDTPEAQLFALTELATGAVTFPPGSTPIIVWFGDASGHDPRNGATEVGATAALQAAGITVIAIDAGGGGDGLDNTGQATRIANATGGVFLSSPNAADTAAAILTGLSNLPADVDMATDCAGPILAGFSEGQTVTSGDDASFTETISVADDAAPGVYECDDWALINGAPMTNDAGEVILEHKTITVGAAYCVEGVNPAGKTPKASGQNEDGFFLIGANPEGLEVEVVDSGSGTVFGPFPTGTNIKYTENDDDISIQPGSGAVDWKIKGLGDALVTFTDDFGNTSYAACLVPPPPK